MNDAQHRQLLDELKAIKMLLVLQCTKSDVKQSEIAQFLGVSEATVSRMMPGKKKSKNVEKA